MKAIQTMTFLCLVALFVGCTSSGDATEPVCSADALNDCVCTSGAAGVQECAEDGTHWLPCECTTPAPLDATGTPDTTPAEDTASTPDVTLPPPKDTGTTPPPAGPSACEVQEDCEKPGACPDDAALGCVCMANAQGTKRCMPQCETAEDCPTPKNPSITLGCNNKGICTKKAGEEQNPPETNSGVLANCKSQEDCDADGGCPNDAPKGCNCIETNNGSQKCIPLCDEDGDCPASLSMDMICGLQQGHCVPDNGNAGRGMNP